MPKRPHSAPVTRRGKKLKATVKSQMPKDIKDELKEQKSVEEIPASETKDLAQKAVVESVSAGKHPELKKLLNEPGWTEVLKDELEKAYFKKLQKFLESEWDHPQHVVYPTAKCVFEAFNCTPFDQVRVVLLGQDPYHGPNQAMGLCFSVPETEKIPGSLKNIYKEIKSDLGYDPGEHGNLTNWAKQGVLLLNTVLTVRASKAHSHKKKGWESFTDRAISLLNKEKSGLVFFLWGKHAQRIGSDLDEEKHLILKAAHPSGLSAYRGFLGCKHFSKCNAYLESNGQKPIDWKV